MKKGIAAVVLANEDFVELAKVVAKSKGVSTLPYVVFPRKINEMSEDEDNFTIIKFKIYLT